MKVHLRNDQLLYVTSLGVEAAEDTVAVASEATTEIFSVDKEEEAAVIFDVAMAGATAASASFDAEEFWMC